MEEVSKTLSEMQNRTVFKENTVFFHARGGEKTSSQVNKYEKLLDDDELYFLIQEDLRPETSQIALDINNAKDMTQQKRRKDAEKPLYLMRYE